MKKEIGNKKLIKQKKIYNVGGYLFLLPAFIFFFIYIVYPIIFVGWGSFFQWSNLRHMKFVGFDNFIYMFKDRTMAKVLKNLVLWVITTVPIQAFLGFLIAYILSENMFSNGKRLFRTIFFLPVATSVSVVAIVWSKMMQPYNGLFQVMLDAMNFDISINILGSTNGAIFGLIVANIWEWTGWSMVMYIAGMSQISQSMKEAAKIDGVGQLQMIIRIYLPTLSGTHKSLLMLGIIGSLQTFALVYAMTNGGPNHASEMPGTYIFKSGFGNQQMGYASALSVLFLVVALFLTIFQIKVLGAGNFMKRENS